MDTRVSRDTRIKVVTEGVLTRFWLRPHLYGIKRIEGLQRLDLTRARYVFRRAEGHARPLSETLPAREPSRCASNKQGKTEVLGVGGDLGGGVGRRVGGGVGRCVGGGVGGCVGGGGLERHVYGFTEIPHKFGSTLTDLGVPVYKSI